VEWAASPGLRVRLLPYTSGPSSDGYQDVPALASWDGLPFEGGEHYFDSNDPKRSFVIAGPSASYRPTDAVWHWHMKPLHPRGNGENFAGWPVDPRRRHWQAGKLQRGSDGRSYGMSDLWHAATVADRIALYDGLWADHTLWSWPITPVDRWTTLRALPTGAEHMLQLGSPEATALNTLLDRYWFAAVWDLDAANWHWHPALVADNLPGRMPPTTATHPPLAAQLRVADPRHLNAGDLQSLSATASRSQWLAAQTALPADELLDDWLRANVRGHVFELHWKVAGTESPHRERTIHGRTRLEQLPDGTLRTVARATW
jgi:hypothetical protein